MEWLAILVAAAASYILGWIWHGMLFGERWMQLVNLKQKDVNKATMPYIMMGSFVATLVTAAALSLLLSLTGWTGAGYGAVLGFLVWAGFIAMKTLDSVFWELRPFELWALNNGYNLLAYLVMGAIIGAWA